MGHWEALAYEDDGYLFWVVSTEDSDLGCGIQGGGEDVHDS